MEVDGILTFEYATDKEQMSYCTSGFLMFVLVCFSTGF
jgi:hypothetical protein